MTSEVLEKQKAVVRAQRSFLMMEIKNPRFSVRRGIAKRFGIMLWHTEIRGIIAVPSLK
jgi:hypothetical protein